MQQINTFMHTHAPTSFPEHQLLYLPGVVDKESFLERCKGCLACAEACPHDSITFVEIEPGVRFPFIDPHLNPCYLCADMPCSAACPNNSLESVPPVRVRMGKAMLDPLRCRCLAGETCTICYDACPLKDRAIIWDADIDAPLINLRFCTGCGVCVHACPGEEIPLMIFPA